MHDFIHWSWPRKKKKSLSKLPSVYTRKKKKRLWWCKMPEIRSRNTPWYLFQSLQVIYSTMTSESNKDSSLSGLMSPKYHSKVVLCPEHFYYTSPNSICCFLLVLFICWGGLLFLFGFGFHFLKFIVQNNSSLDL